MLHHVSVGVANVERAAKFYDAVLGTLGYKRVMEFMPYAVAFGDKKPSFWVQLPNDQMPASVGNGVHIAFSAPTKRAVEAFHRAALDNGGKDEGVPGPRPEYTPEYFGAFVRDIDGNKIEAMLLPDVKPARAASGRKTKVKAKKAAGKKAKAASRKPAKKTKRATKRRKAKRR